MVQTIGLDQGSFLSQPWEREKAAGQSSPMGPRRPTERVGGGGRGMVSVGAWEKELSPDPTHMVPERFRGPG